MHNKCLPQNVKNNKRVYRKRTTHHYNNDRAGNKVRNSQQLASNYNDDNCSISEDVMSVSAPVHTNNLFTGHHYFQDCP